MSRHAHFLAPLLTSAASPWVLRARRLDEAVAMRLSTAFDSATRRRGLLGRAALDPGEALIIAPCNAVHTFGMRFDIDVVYAARDGRVVKIRHTMRPRRMSAAIGAFATIELAAGRAHRLGLRPGDLLHVAPSPSALT